MIDVYGPWLLIGLIVGALAMATVRAWASVRRWCPTCNKFISRKAKKCPYCHSVLDLR